MKKLTSILIALFTLTQTAFAAQTKYQITLTSINKSQNKVLAQMKCEVEQTLKWEDRSSYWNCIVKNKRTSSTQTILSNDANIGVELGSRTAYIIYKLSKRNEIGHFIFNQLKVPTILNPKDLTLYFVQSTKPFINQESYLFNAKDSNEIFEIKVSNLAYIE